MKKQSFITLFSAAALSVALLNLQSCTKEPEDDPGNNNNTGYSSSDDIANLPFSPVPSLNLVFKMYN